MQSITRQPRLILSGIVLAMLAGMPALAAADSAPAAAEKQLYIVQMEAEPAVVMHRKRQRVEAGKRPPRFDAEDGAVREHVSRLRASQERALISGRGKHEKIYSYAYAFNGMAVMLTPDEAAQMRFRKGVKAIWKDQKRPLSTADSARILGLLDSSEGLQRARGLEGEGIIIGIIDSGIAPGHPSMSDREQVFDIPKICDLSFMRNSLLGAWLCGEWYDKEGDQVITATPSGWSGACESGEGFSTDDCNNKLIGARFYNQGFLATGPIDDGDYLSPADADGHGTHMATIAAGNEVEASILGKDAGTIRGMAPRAHVAVYKACWLEPGSLRATCSTADLVDAIEQAVADGVDIINYSIGTLDQSLTDPDDLALLAAADAGVLTAASAGNDGDSGTEFLGTIESPSATPWVISVGASTRPGNRLASGLRVNQPAGIADNYEVREAAFTPPLSSLEPITAETLLANDGSNETDDGDNTGNIYDACTELTNGTEISGNLALIQRGNCTFETKIQNAETAGALGVIVINNDADLIIMSGTRDSVNIPAVMISQADGMLIRNRLLIERKVEITLDDNIVLELDENGDQVATFSARGPDLDFLKPDILAPGTNILGGHARNNANGFRGEDYQYLSGTSQAAPHVAGIAALILEAHPNWSPAEIKSAMMVSARQNVTLNDGSTPDAFDIGAGIIDPNNAVDPGLIYDVATDDYDAFLCRIDEPRVSPQRCIDLLINNPVERASDINLPSIQVNNLVARRDVRRTVRNPGTPQTYVAEVTAPDGVQVTVQPDTLVMGNNDTADYTVEFEGDGSTLNEWLFGNIKWTSADHIVYNPFSVILSYFEVLTNVFGAGESGNAEIPVQFGYDGDYVVRNSGLRKPCVLPDNEPNDDLCTNSFARQIIQDPDQTYEFELPANPNNGVRRFTRSVGNNQLHMRVALFDELTAGFDPANNAADDLDIYVFYCGPDTEATCQAGSVEFVGASANDQTSDEQVDIEFPRPGKYLVDVHGFATVGEDTRFRLYVWELGTQTNTGKLTVSGAPGSATNGNTANLDVAWNGLDKGLWLGVISHSDTEGAPVDYTLVEVSNDPFED